MRPGGSFGHAGWTIPHRHASTAPTALFRPLIDHNVDKDNDDDNDDDDGWGKESAKDDDPQYDQNGSVRPDKPAVQPLSSEQERDLFIPMFALVSLGGLMGVCACL